MIRENTETIVDGELLEDEENPALEENMLSLYERMLVLFENLQQTTQLQNELSQKKDVPTRGLYVGVEKAEERERELGDT